MPPSHQDFDSYFHPRARLYANFVHCAIYELGIAQIVRLGFFLVTSTET